MKVWIVLKKADVCASLVPRKPSPTNITARRAWTRVPIDRSVLDVGILHRCGIRPIAQSNDAEPPKQSLRNEIPDPKHCQSCLAQKVRQLLVPPEIPSESPCSQSPLLLPSSHAEKKHTSLPRSPAFLQCILILRDLLW